MFIDLMTILSIQLEMQDMKIQLQLEMLHICMETLSFTICSVLHLEHGLEY